MSSPISSPVLVVPLWINGKQEYLSQSLDVISPSSNEICWKAAAANTADALRAVEAAKATFPSWSKTKPATRQRILFKTADLLEARTAEYGGFMETEMGADRGVTNYFILPTAIKMLRDIASQITSILGSVPIVEDEGTSAMVWKEPYGVVLGISPWNAPYVFGIRAAATAIATGNTTILKGSELTPRCFWALGQAFSDAGLPAGVLNIIFSNPSQAPEVVNAMIEHPAVKKVNFTGSANTGRKVARACGQNLKPCLMELGGKNSAIILPDANLEKAAKACIAGSFLNSGQICMSTDRIILHASIADNFLAIMKAGISTMPAISPPPPTVVSSSSKSRLASLVSDAISKGADYNDAGNHKHPKEIPSSAGALFAPTVIGNITEKMALWHEEAFGPLVGCVVAQTEDEAVDIANGTEYGLSAAVFTQDLRKGLAIARRLESGAVHINSMTVRDEPALPFGGVKSSGWGRFNTASGMEEFLVTKSVTWDD